MTTPEKNGDQKIKTEDNNNNVANEANNNNNANNEANNNNNNNADNNNANQGKTKGKKGKKGKKAVKKETPPPPKELTEQDLENITKQLDFYFSDSNYPKDEYILNLAKENEGWVPVEVFLKFNKIKSMTWDVNVVEKCFRNCKLVEMSEDGKKVKRLGASLDPMVLENKTVCGTGFSSSKYINKPEVEKAFSVFGKVMSVWPIKDKNKKKRSAFIEFATEDIAKKAIETGTLNYTDAGNEYPITILSKKAYNEQVQEYEKKKQ